MKYFGKVLLLSAGILTGAAYMPLSSLGIEKAEASTSVKLKNVRYQTTGNVLLRTGASIHYKTVITIPKNKLVNASERIGSWYKLTYTTKSGSKNVTKTGWTNTNSLREYYQYFSIQGYFFTKAKTKVYSTPDTKHKESYSIDSNNGFYSTQKIVNSTGQSWYRISYKGKKVFVSSSNVYSDSFIFSSPTKYQAKRDTYVYQFYGRDFAKLIKIPKGEIVSTKKHIGNWYGVTYKGVTGYFYAGDFSSYKEPYQFINTSLTYYFTKKTTNLYASPDTSKAAVFTVGGDNGFASNQKALNKLGETWYRVSFRGKTLYVNSKDVTVNSLINLPAPNLFQTNSDAPVYKSFGPDFDLLATIPKGTTITIVKKMGDWYSVSYKGNTGYVNSANVSAYQLPTETRMDPITYLTKSSVNLNQIADTSSNVVTSIPNSKVVVATAKASNGWYKVSYMGKTGYVPGSAIMVVSTGDPMTTRDSYQFIDLRTQSSVTAKQINDYIATYVNTKGKASILTGKGQAFIDAGNQYSINALYLAAHAIHESGFGTSAISLGKNNLFGFGSYDLTPYVASYRFPTVDMCIDYIASQMKATYLNPSNWKYHGAYLGFSTKTLDNKRIDANSEGMNFYYASDPNWGKAIAQLMEKILPYNKSYYSHATVNTSQSLTVATPDNSDVFPLNILAVANSDLVLLSSKGGNDAVKTLKTGSTFTLLEKTNDYWVKVQVGNDIYWTNDIKFFQYNNYMTVKNLFRTTAPLNIRRDPTSTDNNILSTFNMNDYVSVVLQPDGTLTMDSSKTWYQVFLPDGTTGWVSAKYVIQELQKAAG